MDFQGFLKSNAATISWPSVQAVLALTAEGATVPFIARYRKEKTQNLNEVDIKTVIDLKEDWDFLIERKSFIAKEIEKQGKLTTELKSQIDTCFDDALLEDIYLPYKLKRKSKASLAREAGIEPLAEWIWDIGHGLIQPEPGQELELWAFTFRNEEKGFKDAQAAIDGAVDLLIERISENTELRQKVRTSLFEQGAVNSKKTSKAKKNSKFENYFEFSEKISSLAIPENSHRYLAVRRGWIEEELSLTLGNSSQHPTLLEDLQASFESHAAPAGQDHGKISELLKKAARIAFKAHTLQSIDAEVHKKLRSVADAVAIDVFAQNVRKLLLSPPYGPKPVLGIDPGVRTGCKLAVVDASGTFLADTVIHLQTEEQKLVAKELLPKIVETAKIEAIAVGNGTAGRETEVFVRQILKDRSLSTPVIMVNEAGASVYSASDTAREEFPDLDITVRGAISIARRLQDPLAELVKIDPKSIGVGQYQHDVSQPALKKTLGFVVDSCVNAVGVNLNTASAYLLAHVSGIGPVLAHSIVEHRKNKGLYKSRAELLSVARFSQKTFEQAAGFLRIPESTHPLDNTGIHPENYATIEKQAEDMGLTLKDLISGQAEKLESSKEFKEKVGEFTFKDIVTELKKPGRDPRPALVPIPFRDDLFELKDVQPGMICPGIVTNVTNFGAFVDIGVHQDGLVHISQLANKFVKDPKEVISPGQQVTIKVLDVNLEKKQLAFTLKLDQPNEKKERTERHTEPRAPRTPRGGERRNAAARPASAAVAPAPSDPNAPRPQPRKTSPVVMPSKGPASNNAPRPQRRPERAAFNNPFAQALAGMKSSLPKK